MEIKRKKNVNQLDWTDHKLVGTCLDLSCKGWKKKSGFD